MSKRCSNSKCRKIIPAYTVNGCCPYCGKLYAGVTIPAAKTISRASRPIVKTADSAMDLAVESMAISISDECSTRPVTEGEYCIVRTATAKNTRNMVRKIIFDGLCIEVKRDYFANSSPIGHHLMADIRNELLKKHNFNWGSSWDISYNVYTFLMEGKTIALSYEYAEKHKRKEVSSITDGPTMTTAKWLDIPGCLWNPLP